MTVQHIGHLHVQAKLADRATGDSNGLEASLETGRLGSRLLEIRNGEVDVRLSAGEPSYPLHMHDTVDG